MALERNTSRVWLNGVIVLMGAVVIAIHDSIAFRFLGLALILQGGRFLFNFWRERQR